MKVITEITLGSRGTVVRKVDYEVVDEGKQFYVMRSPYEYKVICKDWISKESDPIEPGTRVYYVLREVREKVSEATRLRIRELKEVIKEARTSKENLLDMRRKIDNRLELLEKCITENSKALRELEGGHTDGRSDSVNSKKTP